MPFASIYDAFINAIILFLGMSVLYKKTPPYDVMEGLLLGTSTGMMLVISVHEFMATPLGPLLAGDIQYIFPIIFGICYFFVFVPQLIFWYRIVLAIGLTTILSVAYTSYTITAWQQITEFSLLRDVTSAIFIIGISVTFAYMLFGRRLSGYFRYVSWLGPYFLYATFGYMTVGQFYRYGAYAFPLFADLALTPAIWLGVIVVLLILIDMRYNLAKVLGISKPVEAA